MDSGTNIKGTVKTKKTKKTVKKKTPENVSGSSQKIAATIFKDLEGKFMLVKVGDNERPATDADIEDIETKLTTLLEENGVNCLAFVTHHAVQVELIERVT